MRLVPKSVLFVPGNRPNMFEKAAIAPAGAIFPDMEDAVPFGEKTAARRDIAANLEKLALVSADKVIAAVKKVCCAHGNCQKEIPFIISWASMP